MTQKQFIVAFAAAVKKSKSKWKVNPSGSLRGPKRHCPVSYMGLQTGEMFEPCELAGAGYALKLSVTAARDIADASDYRGSHTSPRQVTLRAELLKAAGVKEKKEAA